MLNKLVVMLGHLYCGLVAVVASFFIGIMETVVRTLMMAVSTVTGSKMEMPGYPEQRVRVEAVQQSDHKDFIDEAATRMKSNFPIPEPELIEKTKEIIKAQFGCTAPGLLADEFLFIFPIVGPLPKHEFIQVFSSFKMDAALTGSANFYNFSVDPVEPNRVWFFSRSLLKHTGELNFGPQKIPASGKMIESPPQVLSMSFDKEGLCYKFTGGYPVDRTVGNTGGLGGLFGILHALGNTLPFPEGQPWKGSLKWEAYAKHFPSIMKVWKAKPDSVPIISK